MAFISKQFNPFYRFSLTAILCVSFGCFSVIFSSVNFYAHAGQNYAFKVKVKNNTGKKKNVFRVYWQSKGTLKWKDCDIDITLNAGQNKTLTCSTRAKVKKWRRRFRMSGSCSGLNEDGTPPNVRTVYFPLTKKWFSRSWAVNRKNTYTLAFKRDQFRCY